MSCHRYVHIQCPPCRLFHMQYPVHRYCHIFISYTAISTFQVLCKVKVCSYIPQYPVLRIVQGTLHFTPCSIEHIAAINAQRLLVHKYSPLSITRYSLIQLSEVEQCREKKLAQGLTRQHRMSPQFLPVNIGSSSHCPTV